MWSPAKELSVYIWFLFLEKANLIFRKCTRHYHNVIIATCAKNIPRYNKSLDFSPHTSVFLGQTTNGRIEWHATHFYLSKAMVHLQLPSTYFSQICAFLYEGMKYCFYTQHDMCGLRNCFLLTTPWS